jgi:hypothetical protein
MLHKNDEEDRIIILHDELKEKIFQHFEDDEDILDCPLLHIIRFYSTCKKQWEKWNKKDDEFFDEMMRRRSIDLCQTLHFSFLTQIQNIKAFVLSRKVRTFILSYLEKSLSGIMNHHYHSKRLMEKGAFHLPSSEIMKICNDDPDHIDAVTRRVFINVDNYFKSVHCASLVLLPKSKTKNGIVISRGNKYFTSPYDHADSTCEMVMIPFPFTAFSHSVKNGREFTFLGRS